MGNPRQRSRTLESQSEEFQGQDMFDCMLERATELQENNDDLALKADSLNRSLRKDRSERAAAEHHLQEAYKAIEATEATLVKGRKDHELYRSQTSEQVSQLQQERDDWKNLTQVHKQKLAHDKMTHSAVDDEIQKARTEFED